MHSYSIDTNIRVQVAAILAGLALSAPTAISLIWDLTGLETFASFTISSGTVFSLLYLLFDKILWRLPGIRSIHKIPDLRGKWIAKGTSSYKDPETNKPYLFSANVTIDQTFTKIEVHFATGDSTSRSFMADVITQSPVPRLRYGYANRSHNAASDELKDHPGMMDIEVCSDGTLVGNYFSGKHRLRNGSINLSQRSDGSSK